MNSCLFRAATCFFTLFAFTILATVEAVPMANLCYVITCRENCDPDKPEKYQPQRCQRCICPERDGRFDPNAQSIPERIAAMESSISELKATTGVQLSVVILMLLVMVVIFVQGADNIPKLELPVLFCKKKMINSSKDIAPTKNCISATDSLTISRIADKQSDSSIHARTSSISQTAISDTSLLQVRPPSRRMRQPSESSCPEEGNDIGPHGYDNLALSTSTIDMTTANNNTSASTETLDHGISTNTLHTTLPSEDFQASDEVTNTRM